MAEEKKPGDQNSPSFIETARRAQIIECTIEAIAEVGYARTSLAEIARRAGISKGVILYYFHSKKELLEQVISEIYTSGAHFMGPQIAAQPTAARMLQAYIRTDLEYIGTHRLQMMAIVEIVTHYRTKYGDLSYNAVTEEPILQAVESILRKGQQEGEFHGDPALFFSNNLLRAGKRCATQGTLSSAE